MLRLCPFACCFACLVTNFVEHSPISLQVAPSVAGSESLPEDAAVAGGLKNPPEGGAAVVGLKNPPEWAAAPSAGAAAAPPVAAGLKNPPEWASTFDRTTFTKKALMDRLKVNQSQVVSAFLFIYFCYY